MLRRRARAGMDRVLGAIDALAEADGDQTVAAFRQAVDAPGLVEAAAACRAFASAGGARPSRRHAGPLHHAAPIPAGVLALPFQAAVGSEDADGGDRDPAGPRCRHARGLDAG